MAPAQSKNAAEALDIKCSTDHQPTVYVKAAKRFKQIISDYKESDEAIAIPPGKVFVSPFNRLGVYLNLMYAHEDLGPNIHKKGYDPSRPKVGVVSRRTDPAKVKRLKEHALNMQSASPSLYPPLSASSAYDCFECVGGNHLTLVFRFYETNYTSPITGITYVVPEDENELRDKVSRGHNYIVLRDDVPDDDMKFLSEYLNSDQNQNQCTSEISTLAAVDKAVKDELKVTPHPKVSKIVQVVSAESMVKLRPDSIGDMAHYANNLIGTGYVSEVVHWHSRNINPKEMSVSPRWLGDAAKTFGKTYPIVLMGCTFVQYRGELKLEQVRPLPDISRAIGLPELNNQMKDPTNLNACEEYCRDNRKLLTEEQKKLFNSPPKASSCFNIFEEAATRLLFTKSLGSVGFDHNVSGKFTIEKLKSLRHHWVKMLEATYDELVGLAARFDIGVVEGSDTKEKGEEEVHTRGHWVGSQRV